MGVYVKNLLVLLLILHICRYLLLSMTNIYVHGLGSTKIGHSLAVGLNCGASFLLTNDA